MQGKIKTSGWVTLLRVMAYIQIVLGCLLSVFLGIGIMFGTVQVNGTSVAAVAVGLLVLVVGVLLSFLSAALTMVLLGAAEDLHVIRVLTERRQ